MNGEKKENKFYENFYAAIFIMDEFIGRGEIYKFSHFDFLYKHYLRIEEEKKSIRSKGKEPYIDLNLVIENVRLSLS